MNTTWARFRRVGGGLCRSFVAFAIGASYLVASASPAQALIVVVRLTILQVDALGFQTDPQRSGGIGN